MEEEVVVWLNRLTKPSKIGRTLFDRLVDEGVLDKCKGISKDEVISILSAIVRHYKKGLTKVFVSSDRNSYKSEVILNCQSVKARFNFKHTMKTLTSLYDCGYIDWVKGYRVTKLNRAFGYITINKAFSKIIEDVIYLCGEEVENQSECCDVIIITTDEDKRLLKRGEKMVSANVIRDMIRYNSFLGDHDITFNGKELNAWLCRIFKENLQQHGRIYNLYQSVNYQTLSQLDRKSIRIDGDRTAELDFKHLHPSLMYEMLGVKFEKDVYTLDLDYDEIFDTEEGISGVDYTKVLRDLCKQTLLRMINNSSKPRCYVSVTNMLLEDEELENPFKKYPNLYTDKYNVAKILVNELEKLHFELAPYFYQEMSLALMAQDSDILMMILSECMNKGIVALPLHDSVSVKESDKEVVLQIMEDAYNSAMGSKLNCKIEEK